jgi:hypothetical protein
VSEVSVSGIRLHDVVGRPTEANGILFVPARFDFESEQKGPDEFPLSEQPDAQALQGTLVSHEIEPESLLILWAESRVRAVFLTSGMSRWCSERFEVAFVAATRFGDDRGPSLVPFLLLGSGGFLGSGGPALAFRIDVDAVVKRQIASAFYGLLLRDPADLVPFETHHQDDFDFEFGGWDRLGYARGEFYACELTPWVDGDLWAEYQPLDDECLGPRVSLFADPMLCPDCGGSGEESFCPAGEVCETCEGRGELNVSDPWPDGYF